MAVNNFNKLFSHVNTDVSFLKYPNNNQDVPYHNH